MDHVQPPEASVLIDDVPDKLHDSKHAVDFIQNEVQSYDNAFVKSKPELLENGDQLSEPEQLPVSVDLMNGSHENLVPLTPQVDDVLKSDVPDISVHSSTPDVFSADLLREVSDISPVKTFDLVDVDKPSYDLLVDVDEPEVMADVETVASDNFHVDDYVEEQSQSSVVPDMCDFSNKPTETSSVEVEAEQPNEPKIEKEIVEETKCEKPAVTSKANPLEKSEIGPKDFFIKYGLDTWFNPDRLDPTVEAYIYWRDPKLSGIIFGSGLVLLLSLAYFSLISVVANAGLAILTCAIVFRIYKDIMQAVQKTPQTHPYSVFLNRDIALPQEKVHELIDTLILHINACLGELRRLFLVEDMIESLKFALVLWILTYVGSWFNGLTLVIIGFVALFTLPKVYENNKVQIDQNLALVRAKVEELANKIREALPAPLRRKVPEKKE